MVDASILLGMISSSVVAAAREAMRQQTKVNNAPAWRLTEIAVKKGRELAGTYGVDVSRVVIALYLAHAEFSDEIGGEVQRNHPRLSAEFAKHFLVEHRVSNDDIEVVLNAIRAHHDDEAISSKEAEIVKNAEAFKFVSIPGALIFLHDLGRRELPLEDAAQEVLRKLDQKLSYLTLVECKNEAAKNAKAIRKLMASLTDPES